MIGRLKWSWVSGAAKIRSIHGWFDWSLLVPRPFSGWMSVSPPGCACASTTGFSGPVCSETNGASGSRSGMQRWSSIMVYSCSHSFWSCLALLRLFVLQPLDLSLTHHDPHSQRCGVGTIWEAVLPLHTWCIWKLWKSSLWAWFGPLPLDILLWKCRGKRWFDPKRTVSYPLALCACWHGSAFHHRARLCRPDSANLVKKVCFSILACRAV